MSSWLRRVFPLSLGGVTRQSGRSRLASASRPLYTCDLDEEPVQNYKPGGYHPVQIGDKLDKGRYKILHKLGWGGFSTVWAAKDEKTGTNVALKILQAAASGEKRPRRGLQNLQYLRDHASDHPGFRHIASLRNEFQQHGPNGDHKCLVLDLTGPSIQDYINKHVQGIRLPGKLAKTFARQTLSALTCLHANGITHGDLHNNNLAIGVPSLASASESKILASLGSPRTEPVTRTDGGALTPNVPPYIVKPSSFSSQNDLDFSTLKLVDFGASFRGTVAPTSLLNPPVIRSPEQFFGDTLDHRVDLWSMGCTLFELVSGQTPFESDNATPESIARQMLYLIRDEFPERWAGKRRALEEQMAESRASSLREWLGLLYFDSEEGVAFSKDEVERVGGLVERLLRFEPGERASAEEILDDEWFDE
ncbi:Protein kinase dsk1 [Elsinoe australis]|uniref:Protein kinase dsk1 n=1 Tax=Elsinoe australis TaxID=40998 RepID=A0A2P7YF03_9PEZI|nr:Protein kinase dsk1 [Elsinoe australis]